jgi:hypothetical protein
VSGLASLLPSYGGTVLWYNFAEFIAYLVQSAQGRQGLRVRVKEGRRRAREEGKIKPNEAGPAGRTFRSSDPSHTALLLGPSNLAKKPRIILPPLSEYRTLLQPQLL